MRFSGAGQHRQIGGDQRQVAAALARIAPAQHDGLLRFGAANRLHLGREVGERQPQSWRLRLDGRRRPDIGIRNRELQFIREMGAEFAEAYPRIAARLGLDGIDCADPYVERLLEGFAYLTARVQLKLDAEYPTFTHNLLEVAYPHYLAPTPSMTVVQLQADPDEGSLSSGFSLPRGSYATILVKRLTGLS